MGGLKKAKVATPQAGTEKGKEIRIVTKHVYTVSDVEKNPRLIKLLYVISLAKEGMSEKALTYVLHHMTDSGVNTGYKFIVVGGVPVSRELLNDLTILKYTGLVELDSAKKLRVTGSGKDLLDKMMPSIQSELDVIKKAFEENWNKVIPIDVEVSLKSKTQR